eukprot:jgi/Psemu1/24738/gm1.24738_g
MPKAYKSAPLTLHLNTEPVLDYTQKKLHRSSTVQRQPHQWRQEATGKPHAQTAQKVHFVQKTSLA